jgi:hypothetical protein
LGEAKTPILITIPGQARTKLKINHEEHEGHEAFLFFMPFMVEYFLAQKVSSQYVGAYPCGRPTGQAQGHTPTPNY